MACVLPSVEYLHSMIYNCRPHLYVRSLASLPSGWWCIRLLGLDPDYGVVVFAVLIICAPGWFGGRWSLLCRLALPPDLGL